MYPKLDIAISPGIVVLPVGFDRKTCGFPSGDSVNPGSLPDRKAHRHLLLLFAYRQRADRKWLRMACIYEPEYLQTDLDRPDLPYSNGSNKGLPVAGEVPIQNPNNS
jgi:hypothetical protein